MGSTHSTNHNGLFPIFSSARYKRLPDSSALLRQPLLQQQNLFTEIEHEVQAHREKSSALEKEILGLKSSFSRLETMVQTKLQSRPISEAKAIEAIIISLKEKVDKLGKSLDGEIIGRVTDKRIYSSNDGVIPSDSLFSKARYGEDTIIANLDTARCQRLPDSSALLRQPLLQQQNLFTEIEHEVQAHREKSSPLEKEILGLKSSFSRLETMVQTKLQSRPMSEAKAIEAIIINLKEKVDKLEKSLDGEIIGRVADKRIYSSVFSKQGLALKRLEDKNSEVEKEIAELKTRVDEMTSTMVDMASVIAELKLESIQPKEILGLKSSFSRLETMVQTKLQSRPISEAKAIEAIIISLKEKVDKLEKSLDGEIIGRVTDKRINSSVFSKQGLALKRLEEKNSEVEKEIAEPKTRVDEMTSTMVDMASVIAELKLESIQPKEANESTRVRITEMGMKTVSKEGLFIVLVILT